MLVKIENKQLHTICNTCLSENITDISEGTYLSEYANYFTPPCTCGSSEVFLLNSVIDESLGAIENAQRQCIQELRAILEEGN